MMDFLISNVQKFDFSQIWHSEMSISMKTCMFFWQENSNVVKNDSKKFTFIIQVYILKVGSNANSKEKCFDMGHKYSNIHSFSH